jgi:hypothetical protein
MITQENRINSAGVSEAIGFLLIFTMVIVGIGLVTLYGYPMLLEQQTNADQKIMEKNMIVLQNDVKSLAYKTVPYKETSLKIGAGGLTVYNASNTPVSIKITDGASPMVNAFRSGDLRYESMGAQSVISLQNGAVVTRNSQVSGSAMLAKPRWFYDSYTNTMVVNLISFNSSETLSRAGIGTVQMEMVGEPTYISTTSPPGVGNTFELQYTPDPAQDYDTAWDNYFLQFADPNGGMGTTRYYKFRMRDSNPDPTLVIKIYDVNIKSL